MSDSFDFSLVQQVLIPVKGPDGKDYTLKSASGMAAKVYNNARLAGITLGPDGKPSRLEGIGGLESLLVSLCLFGENDRPLTQQFVEKWPYGVIKKLHDKAKEISDLDEGEDPVRAALNAALARPDSPVTADAWKQFVLGLPKDVKEYRPLRSLYREDELGN